MLDEAEIELELACLALVARLLAQPLVEGTCLNDFASCPRLASYKVVCGAANRKRLYRQMYHVRSRSGRATVRCSIMDLTAMLKRY
jgi:hypothetical protein